MKNKIIALVLCSVLLFASLAIGTAATEKDIFTLSNMPEGATFEMIEYPLKDISSEYIEEMFDGVFYDASLYGAYKASLSDADGLAIAFTESMALTINIGEGQADTEVFVFHVKENTGDAYAAVPTKRNGADLVISGKDFAAISGDIIVVMTSNKSLMTGPEYTWVPAAICAGVAVIAITVSVLVVKKKSSKQTITDKKQKSTPRGVLFLFSFSYDPMNKKVVQMHSASEPLCVSKII